MSRTSLAPSSTAGPQTTTSAGAGLRKIQGYDCRKVGGVCQRMEGSMSDTEISRSAATNPVPTPLMDVEEALRDVVDPELGVNVVDLGLVYGLEFEQDNALLINMTLTSAACPLTEVIEEQVGKTLLGLVNEWRLNWVWMPPWGPDRITDDGRDQMRGFKT